MSYVYARDLKPEYQTDSFMGEGFEKIMKEYEERGEDLIIGKYDDSWKKEVKQ